MPCKKKVKKKESRFGGNEKGSISFFIVFVFLAFITLTLFVFIIPILIDFNTRIYSAGEGMLQDANESAALMQDATVRAQFNASITSAQNSIPQQVEVLAFFFQYAWILIILIIVLALYIYTRQAVEAESGRGGIG